MTTSGSAKVDGTAISLGILGIISDNIGLLNDILTAIVLLTSAIWGIHRCAQIFRGKYKDKQ